MKLKRIIENCQKLVQDIHEIKSDYQSSPSIHVQPKRLVNLQIKNILIPSRQRLKP